MNVGFVSLWYVMKIKCTLALDSRCRPTLAKVMLGKVMK